jgi:hypothetical protein
MNKIKKLIFNLICDIGNNPKIFIAGAVTGFIGAVLGILSAHIK